MRTLRVPDEARFVQAFAPAVDADDTLSLLMEIGAVGSPDVGIVRHTREALASAYDSASELKDWDQAHAVSILREALAKPDGAAYLSYYMRVTHCAASSTEYTEALAIVVCAADTMGCRRRPWELQPDALSLPEWRQRVARLLSSLPCAPPTTGGENVPRSPSPRDEAAP